MNPVDDFLKTAGWWDTLKSGFGQALPGAIIGAGLAAGGQLGSAGYGAIKERLTKTRDYKAMLGASPALKKFDAGQVQMVYNSLRSHAPSMSKDPLIAGSFVYKTLDLAPESGPHIDPQTAKLLAETQRNVVTARSGRGSISEAFKPTAITSIDPDPFIERDMRGEAHKWQGQQQKLRQQEYDLKAEKHPLEMSRLQNTPQSILQRGQGRR
jgi:hypothetical protein